ncbi:hypothetical protein EUGRSUZ_L01483 [Eucalyptus grandis]|uniref:non-specific serine/threonine protein kinase n=1 Tax=Eucalyptus grandis TaxID=71139 RepID=A0A058ZUC4_EUCGR|nr:hypothetical protein EUGRSUZ_L01483 [Eucalyptus grandis]
MDHCDPDPNRPNESPTPAQSPSGSPSSDQRPAAGQGTGDAPASHSGFVGQLPNDLSGDSMMSELGLGVRPAEDGWSEVYAPSWQELASRKLHAEVGGYDQEQDQMHAASTSSLGGQRRWAGDAASKKDEVSAETQSVRYWEYNVIDYEEKVVDGFYDAYGISTDSRLQGKMPSLIDLETDPGISGFEAIIVDHRIDLALEELMQIAHRIGLDCPATEITILVQRLAELVTGHMGGQVEDANIMCARWVKRTTELRTSLQTNVLTIGSINVGLSRHRALLFKVLADSINLPCRLVKGGHYTGVQNDAVNLIKLDDEREYLVNLMAAPGTLIPAGFCSEKDDKPYNGEISKLPSFQAPNELEVVQSRPQPSAGERSSQSSVMETDSYVARKSSSKTSESFPSSPFASHDPGVGSSRVSGGRAQQLNVNVVPQSNNSSEDPTNISADLNPFAAKVSGKAPVEGNSPGVKISEMPRQKNSSVPESSHWNPFSENSPMLECSTGQYNTMPCEERLNAQVREDPLRTQENLQHGIADSPSGSGSYGEVFCATWSGMEVAVKKFFDQHLTGAALDMFKREVQIIRRLRHPNVVLFMGAVAHPPHLSIITEFVPRGSLYSIIHHPHCPIDEKRRIKMALDVARGMNYLHTSVPTIVHRDLKSPNLLVDEDWNVKVCDFGLSRLKHNTFLSSKSTAGTAEWMAPEVLRNKPANEKCDIFSFGVILWELATLRIPWSGMNSMQVVGAVGYENRRLEIPNEVDPLVGKIICDCWQTEPNLRPSFAELAGALESLQRLVIP